MTKHLKEMFRLIDLLKPGWDNNPELIFISDCFGFRPKEDFKESLLQRDFSQLDKELAEQNVKAVTFQFLEPNNFEFIFCAEKHLHIFDWDSKNWEEHANEHQEEDCELTIDLETGNVSSMLSPRIREFVRLTKKLNIPNKLQRKVENMFFEER